MSEEKLTRKVEIELTEGEYWTLKLLFRLSKKNYCYGSISRMLRIRIRYWMKDNFYKLWCKYW